MSNWCRYYRRTLDVLRSNVQDPISGKIFRVEKLLCSKIQPIRAAEKRHMTFVENVIGQIEELRYSSTPKNCNEALGLKRNFKSWLLHTYCSSWTYGAEWAFADLNESVGVDDPVGQHLGRQLAHGAVELVGAADGQDPAVEEKAEHSIQHFHQ